MTRREVMDKIIDHGNNKWECCGVWTYAPNIESAIGRILNKIIKGK